MEIIEYGIGNYKHSEVYIDNAKDVLERIIAKADEMCEKINDDHMMIKIDSRNDSNIRNIDMYENGIVISISNTIPSAANQYDDFSTAKMYIFNGGEIHYIFDKVDTRIEANKGGEEVNKEKIEELDSQLGAKKNKDVQELESLLDSIQEQLLEDNQTKTI